MQSAMSQLRADQSLMTQSEFPLSKQNVRRKPIVGDVHMKREEWPETREDWSKLWSLPKPIRVCKIRYSVNVRERAFDAISL